MTGEANRVQPVTANATQVSGTFSSDYQIINVGTTIVYLGQSSALSATNYGVPLSPGGSLQWSGKSELWAICAAGQVGSMSILYSATSLFTPGPSIIASRLISDLTLLDTETVNLPVGGISSGGGLRVVNVSDYSSVLVTLEITGAFTPVTANYIFSEMMFSDTPTLGGNPKTNNVYNPQWLMTESTPNIFSIRKLCSIQMPVTGKYLYSFTEFSKNPTIASGTYIVKIYGSNESIVSARYASEGVGLDGTPGFWMITQAASLTVTHNIASRSGPAQVAATQKTGSAPSASLLVYNYGASQRIENLVSTVTGSSKLITFPMAPISFLALTAATSTADFSVIQN